MEEKTKRTKRTYSDGPINIIKRIVEIIFIIIEILLGFRLVLKFLGANPDNFFVNGIYSISQVFVGVFQGIFSEATTDGLETTSVFEPGTLIAMIVIGIIAWIILMIINSVSRNSVKEEEVIEEQDN